MPGTSPCDFDNASIAAPIEFSCSCPTPADRSFEFELFKKIDDDNNKDWNKDDNKELAFETKLELETLVKGGEEEDVYSAKKEACHEIEKDQEIQYEMLAFSKKKRQQQQQQRQQQQRLEQIEHSLFLRSMLQKAARTVRPDGTPKGLNFLNSSSSSSFFSYETLLRDSLRLCRGIQTKEPSLKAGTVVVFQLENSYACFVAFWACQFGGWLPLPVGVPPSYLEEGCTILRGLKGAISITKTPLLLVSTLAQEKLLTSSSFSSSFASTSSSLFSTISLEGLGISLNLGASSSETCTSSSSSTSTSSLELEISSDSHLEFTRTPSNQPVLLMLTSGSTGIPKVVMLSESNLVHSVNGKASKLGFSNKDVFFGWISPTHVACLIDMHLIPVSLGADQVHVDPASVLRDPVAFLKAIDQHRVTATFAPNFLFGHINRIFDSMKSRPSTNDIDLSSLRVLISGGEAVVTKTALTLLENLVPYRLLQENCIRPAFGMTETSAGSIFNNVFTRTMNTAIEEKQPFAPVGTSIAEFEFKLIDDEGNEVEDGSIGHLVVNGPQVFLGYYNNQEATAESFFEVEDSSFHSKPISSTSSSAKRRWFRTGDLGSKSPLDGSLLLAGRSKDSIIINGTNFYSHEIEAILEETIPQLERSFTAAVPVRLPNKDTEDYVIFFVGAFSEDDEAFLYKTVAKIRHAAVLAAGKPVAIIPTSKARIPKSNLGKTLRTMLQRQFLQGQFESELERLRTINESRKALGVATTTLEGHQAPRDELESTLVEVWGEVLGISTSEIDLDISFYELGGSSVETMVLKRLLDEKFNSNISVISFLHHPTIREFAEYWREESSKSLTNENLPMNANYNPVVKMTITSKKDADLDENSKKKKTPFWCVHPGVGDVMIFIELAKRFAGKREFYALRARGFNEGETFFKSFNEMVSTYVEAIIKTQPEGPYNIAGYSYGGVVAFEVAKGLERTGRVVAFTGVFNIPPYIRERMHQLNWHAGLLHLMLFVDLLSDEQVHRLEAKLEENRKGEEEFGISEEDWLEECFLEAPEKRMEELNLNRAKLKHWVDLAHSLVVCGRQYDPSETVLEVSVFQAIPLFGTIEEWHTTLLGWKAYSRNPPRFFNAPGEHYSMMSPHHVADFAKILLSAIDQANNNLNTNNTNDTTTL